MMPHITNYDHCLRFQVMDKIISFIDGASAEVVADNRGNICIHIDFDEQWDGVGKTVRFIYNGAWKDVPLNTDGECICPSEVLKKGRFSLGVYGAELKTTTPIVVNVRASILSDCEGELPPDPTSGEYEQIMQLYQATCEAADDVIIKLAEAIEALEASSKLFVDTKEELEEGGFITGIKDIHTGRILRFWIGSQEEYDSLPEEPKDCYVLITDDDTVTKLMNRVHMVDSGDIYLIQPSTLANVKNMESSLDLYYELWSNGIAKLYIKQNYGNDILPSEEIFLGANISIPGVKFNSVISSNYSVNESNGASVQGTNKVSVTGKGCQVNYLDDITFTCVFANLGDATASIKGSVSIVARYSLEEEGN